MLTSENYQSKILKVTDLQGELISISVAVSSANPKTVFIESAQIVGTQLVAASSVRNPGSYSSFGIGEAILWAIENHAQRIVIGLGGTALIDGGAGMLAALGAEPRSKLAQGGLALAEITEINLSAPLANLTGVELVVAADVDVPLLGSRGAAFGFGLQKGATAEQQAELEAALTNYSSVMPKRIDGKDAALMLGAGAAGGIGYAAMALGATKVSGFHYIAAAMELIEQVAAADLVITGEGSFDWQSMQGKAVSQLAAICAAAGKPLLVLAGRVDVGRREWSAIGVVGAYGCSPDGELPEQPFEALASLANRVARTFSPVSWQT
jgi:glycerate kinase